MATYLLAYRGGSMAQTDEERERVMAAWGAWFGTLGPAVVDAGNPFGPSASVGNGGGAAPSGLTGYSILTESGAAGVRRGGSQARRVRRGAGSCPSPARRPWRARRCETRGSSGSGHRSGRGR